MLFYLTILFLFVEIMYGSETRFTNFECESFDTTYSIFEKCELKVLGRGIVGLNLHVKFLQGPFNSAKVNLSLWRKYNGYRPFMFNTTVDFCKYMANKNPVLSFAKIVHSAVLDKSNLNHTCPYNHDIIVKNLVMKEEYLKFLPMPSGEYKIQMITGTSREWKANVNIYISRKEDLLKS